MPQPAADSVSLNKFISDTGFCSRREADGYIEDGRVSINGKAARTGNRVRPGDLVEIDGEPLGRKRAPVYLAYNKPAGVTSTTDAKDRTNIVSAIDFKERIFPVGRLDKDSEGLIFLTNDGSIVNRILRAGNAHEKEYVVGVDRPLTGEFIRAMGAGVRIGDETTLPCKITQEGKTSFRITLVQGLNRQIRRMCSALGYEVTRLRRVRIMNMHLGNLPAGHWRYFNADETATLQRMIESSSEAPTTPKRERSAAGGDDKRLERPERKAGAAPASTRSRQEKPAKSGRAAAAKQDKPQKSARAGSAASKNEKPAKGGRAADKKTGDTPGRRGAAREGSFKDFRSRRSRKG